MDVCCNDRVHNNYEKLTDIALPQSPFLYLHISRETNHHSALVSSFFMSGTHMHIPTAEITEIGITNFITVITIHLLNITWNPVLLQAELFKKIDGCLLANCGSSSITIKRLFISQVTL